MFLEKYLTPFYYDEVIDNYTEDFLYSLNEINFREVYEIFQKYQFYFIDDIILKYLEIFTMNKNDVENKIKHLKDKLGPNFVYIIGQDMRYLSYIIEV